MTAYVQYHSAKQMGYGCAGISDPSILTKRAPPQDVAGSTVYLIVGEPSDEGTKYYLRLAFPATEIAPSGRTDDLHVKISESASSMILCDPPIRIDQEPWFEDFRARNGNFRYGLRRQEETDATRLQSLLP